MAKFRLARDIAIRYKCGMEKLRAHLQGKKHADFAHAIGTSPAYLSQLLNGHRRPSYGMMLRIEAASDGFVDLRSWSPSSQPVRAD